MTLAALSPLYTWWPLFFLVLLFTVKVAAPLIARRQESPWPPPVVLQLASPWWMRQRPLPAHLMIYAGWPPPNDTERVG